MEGKITISQWHSNGPTSTGIRISVEDKASGIGFVDIEITPENFALAVTGRGYIPVDFTVRGLESLGRKAEHKQETVTIPFIWSKYDFDTDKAMRESLRPFIEPMETDGWVANYYVKGRGQVIHDDGQTRIRIRFTRYVEPTDEQ